MSKQLPSEGAGAAGVGQSAVSSMDSTVTIELHVATASILLSELLGIDTSPTYPLVFTRDWHLNRARETLKEAMLAWPESIEE